jgi:hypothetical protein
MPHLLERGSGSVINISSEAGLKGLQDRAAYCAAKAALVAAFASPEGKTLLADLPNFAGDIDPIISVETQILWP